MFAIIGLVVVIAAIVGGYVIEHGHLIVLLQPAELLIIGGAAIGTVLTANPVHVLKALAAGFAGVIKGSRHDRALYIDSLALLFDMFQTGRRGGLVGLESHIEAPDQSDLFKKRPNVLADHHAVAFVCDTFRTALAGNISPFDMDQMMEGDLEIHHKIAHQPIAALSTMADSLPGLGIVAAVLGVVITMGALGGPPEEIGHKVAAALVGTFLGILLCYGFIGPIAASMAKATDEEHAFYHVLRVVIVSFIKGSPPSIAVEFGRRAIPGHVRPGFQELENHIKERGEAAPPAA